MGIQQLSRGTDKFLTKNYLDRCQVSTPIHLVDWVWKMVGKRRPEGCRQVIDLGCGDARFALGGNYTSYLGLEIDKQHGVIPNLPRSATIKHGCGLLTLTKKFSLCIGNPPYVRHHDIDDAWRHAIVRRLESVSDIQVDLRANAFLYFLLKAIQVTRDDGLVALVVPFEWVTRPSSKWLRDYIEENKWGVSVYRLPEKLFPRVLTTSALTIIDKRKKNGAWNYFQVDESYHTKETKNPTGGYSNVLQYSSRLKDIFAQRGLSPGTQEVFCLTEGERVHNGLHLRSDVTPCLTSMKSLPKEVKVLTRRNFERYFVDTGEKCWLIRSDRELSTRLKDYLAGVKKERIQTSTCQIRDTWYQYKIPPTPNLLYSTGFTCFGPHIVENAVKAIAVGSVGGVHISSKLPYRNIAQKLRKYNFESRVVNHSGLLKKLEINQLNTILRSIYKKLK